MIFNFQRTFIKPLKKGHVMSDYAKDTDLAVYIKRMEGLSTVAIGRIQNIDGYAKQMLYEAIGGIYNAIKRVYIEIKGEEFPENIEF